jgi:hypothetical protein
MTLRGEGFLLQTVMGEDNWIHHFEPKSKQHLMDQHETTSARTKEFKSVPAAGKIKVTDFSDEKGVSLVSFFPRVTTVNSQLLY